MTILSFSFGGKFFLQKMGFKESFFEAQGSINYIVVPLTVLVFPNPLHELHFLLLSV